MLWKGLSSPLFGLIFEREASRSCRKRALSGSRLWRLLLAERGSGGWACRWLATRRKPGDRNSANMLYASRDRS